jgi:hypothetical protein
MRRVLLLVAAASIAAALVAPAATAEKPIREPAPGADFTLPASICGFEVGVEVLTNKEYAITFSNGLTIVTGALKVRVTNLADPSKSMVLNISGPGFFTSDELRATGSWFLFFLPGELGPGAPGTLLNVTGSFRLEFGETLALTDVRGTSLDLCQALG